MCGVLVNPLGTFVCTFKLVRMGAHLKPDDDIINIIVGPMFMQFLELKPMSHDLGALLTPCSSLLYELQEHCNYLYTI